MSDYFTQSKYVYLSINKVNNNTRGYRYDFGFSCLTYYYATKTLLLLNSVLSSEYVGLEFINYNTDILFYYYLVWFGNFISKSVFMKYVFLKRNSAKKIICWMGDKYHHQQESVT